MSNVTAVVLTAGDYVREWPGLEVVVRRQVIRDAAELQAARFDAIEHVETPHFFFLDDDDDLPPDCLDVLEECRAAKAPIAYTDELVMLDDGRWLTRVNGPYSRDSHYRDALLVHHLVLCETAAARESVARLPRGHYCPEFMLYWDMACNGAAYVPRVGYIWMKRADGMHMWPCTTLSQARAKLRVKAELSARAEPNNTPLATA